MKIHEYDQMMKHLTRPASKYSKTEKDKIIKDHYKDSADYFKKQKIPVHQQLTNLKNFGRNKLADHPMKTSQKYVYDNSAKGLKDTKTGKVNILNEATATDNELYLMHNKDPVRYVETMRHRYDGTKAPSDYPKEASPEQMAFLEKQMANHRAHTGPTNKIVKTPIGNVRYVGTKEAPIKKVAEKAKPTEFKEYKFEIPDFYFEEEEEQKRQDELRKHNFDKILLSSALNKIDDTLSGINGVAVRRKLNEGGPTDDNNNKPILLSDYLKLGLTLANLTDSEREIVKDLLDKSFPKYK